jgi:hypothetical protein
MKLLNLSLLAFLVGTIALGCSGNSDTTQAPPSDNTVTASNSQGGGSEAGQSARRGKPHKPG